MPRSRAVARWVVWVMLSSRLPEIALGPPLGLLGRLLRRRLPRAYRGEHLRDDGVGIGRRRRPARTSLVALWQAEPQGLPGGRHFRVLGPAPVGAVRLWRAA